MSQLKHGYLLQKYMTGLVKLHKSNINYLIKSIGSEVRRYVLNISMMITITDIQYVYLLYFVFSNLRVSIHIKHSYLNDWEKIDLLKVVEVVIYKNSI